MKQAPMKVDLRDGDQVICIHIEGSINSAFSPQLREAIQDAFKKKVVGVVIDLGDVSYIDSSGLATLVEGVQTAASKNGKFVLAGTLDQKIQHMLEITRLSDLFEHYDTVESAQAALQA